MRAAAGIVGFARGIHIEQTISIGVLARSLEQNVPEVRQGGLQLEGLLRLLHHVEALAPAVGGVHLSQVRGEEHVRLDAGGVDADHARALGVDAEQLDGVLLDGSAHCLGVQLVLRGALGALSQNVEGNRLATLLRASIKNQDIEYLHSE